MQTIQEDSPNTPEGSFTRDLIFSKFWLMDAVERCTAASGIYSFDTAVVLGSWYGNMALILNVSDLDVKQITLIDIDPDCIAFSKWLYRDQPRRIRSILGDANAYNYTNQLKNRLIINTSCNDISGQVWFENIPAGSLVALQSRDDHESLSVFDRRFPLDQTFYLGSKKLSDPVKTYQRFTKVGFK
jgi:hypothetical protein